MLTALRNRVGVLALVAAILVNLAQFPFVDRRTIPPSRALHRFETGDVFAQRHWLRREFRFNFGLPLALAGLAPGSTVLVADPGPYAKEDVLLQLAGVGRARVRTVSPDVADRIVAAGRTGAVPFDPLTAVVARGGGRDGTRPWVISMKDPAESTPAQFILLSWPVRAAPLRAAPRRDPVAAARARGAGPWAADPPRASPLRPTPRASALPATPRPGAPGPARLDLLLDTSLLPEDLRTEVVR